MIISLLAFLLTSIICSWHWDTQVFQQDASDGKDYFSESKLQQWERCLFEIPIYCGEMKRTMIKCPPSHGTKALENRSSMWHDGSNGLVRLYIAEGNEETFDLLNSDYGARVRKDIAGIHRLESIYPHEQKGPCPDSPFRTTSTCSNQSKLLIPGLIRNGNLRIAEFESRNGQHFVTLVPGENQIGEKEARALQDVERIELVFDDRYPPLPVARKIKAKNYESYCEWSEFLEIVPGFFLPQRGHGNPGSSDRESISKISYDPATALDPKWCKLEYYGIPKPGYFEVTDFGRVKSNWYFWCCGIVAVIAATALLGMMVRNRFQ